MKQRILAIVRELQQQREAAHIQPPHVLTSEIINRGCPNPYQAINELVKEHKVSWRRTLNDVALTINKELETS